jgi:hypothetical protein
MKICNEIEGFTCFLQFDSRFHHPEVVAEVRESRRLDAGKNAHKEK